MKVFAEKENTQQCYLHKNRNKQLPSVLTKTKKNLNFLLVLQCFYLEIWNSS